MMGLFDAKEYYHRLEEIDPEAYRKRGFDVLFIDIDNTLSPFYEDRPDERARSLLSRFEASGFTIFIISNNTSSRVKTYCDGLPVTPYAMSLKPFGFNYEKILKKYGYRREEILCIGDQLITDIFGGNLRGLYTIYVDPIIEKDNLPGKITRFAERILFDHFIKR